MTLRFHPIYGSARVAVCLLAVASPLFAANKARVELLPAVSAIRPGTPFDVAIKFDIDREWHIYWQNAGESGQAPRVQWTVPPGFEAGDLQFPVPKRDEVANGLIVTNVLEGQPVLLVAITPPKSLPGSDVRLSADVHYLVCREKCLLERAKIGLRLPVAKDGASSTAANEGLFARARARLPRSKSRYLTITPRMVPEEPKSGSTFVLQLDVNVGHGFHVQAHNPSLPSLVATDVFVEASDDVYWERAEFPDPQTRVDPKLGRISQYAGSFRVRVPGEIESDAVPPYDVGGILAYQACNDQGRCFPPEAVRFSVSRHADPASQQGSVLPAPAPNSAFADKTAVRSGDDPDSPDSPEAAGGGAMPPVEHTGSAPTFLGILGLAFLGGLILNVMPCVLPVISIKILSFVQQAKENRKRIFRLGLAFAAGVLLSFWALALTIIAIKAGGSAASWGFQFQEPRFVILMMSLMFVFGLSLLGVFTITLPGAAVGKLSAAEEREGYAGAFSKGVLATILATPCTAPFLGPALGVAFTSPNDKLFLIFTAVGLGMASPFVVLSAQPAWLRFLPKPGAWMERFKQAMGFLLMGTVVWLMFTLGVQIGVDGLAWATGFLVLLGVAAWILGLQTPATPAPRRVLAWVAASGIAVVGWWFSFERDVGIEHYAGQARMAKHCPCETEVPVLVREDWERQIPWQPWVKGRAEHLADLGYTVYVDYTATWCATCLANKKATLETDSVRSQMRDQCVIPVKADFTSKDPDIEADLRKFGRAGVPLNVIYPAGRPDAPILLPEQLVGRAALVLDKLAEAGASFNCSTITMADR